MFSMRQGVAINNGAYTLIQLRKLRFFTPQGSNTELGWDEPVIAETAPSAQELIKNYEKYLELVPKNERWNLFVSTHPCTAKKRDWNAPQNVILIDVDEIDTSKASVYVDKICKLLGLDASKTQALISGNGLHLPIELKTPITEREFFEKNRPFFKAICTSIESMLTSEGLKFKCVDPAVFKPTTMIRMPGTENRKAGRESKQVILLNRESAPQEFDLKKLSGLPDVPENDQVSENERKFFTVDTKGVLEGCLFLKHCKEDAQSLPEPQWFAMLSILPRLENGRELSHEYSKGHKGYSYEETETKIDQALAASGPRTCKNINDLWGGCSACPYFEKCKSPISIRGKDFIETQGSGFHKIMQDPKTGKVRKVPCYEDLRKYFEKLTRYKTLGASEIVYVWTGTHYVDKPDAELKAFAQEHFNPYADTHMVSEFTNLIHRTNLRSPAWFDETIKGRINFKNGILLENGSLVPHSDEYGFRDMLPYEYDANAVCPAFDKFLDDVMCGDESLKANFLEYTGYALSNDPIWLHKAWVLLGSGENGKSTALDIIRELAGKENYTSVSIGDLKNEGTRQMLDGKYFNISEETPTRALADSTHFKNLSAGGEINVRQIYKKPYSMRNKAKLIFACNELPGSTDSSQGFFRRFLIMPFKATFSSDPMQIKNGTAKAKDPFIKDKIIQELPGIFNKVRAYYQQVKKRGKFTDSKATDAELEKFKSEVDYTGTWIKENIRPGTTEDDYIVSSDLYASYAQEMERMNLEPLHAIAFGRKHGYEIKVRKHQGKPVRALVKCKLANDSISSVEKF